MLPLRLVLDTNIIVSAILKPDGLQRTVFLLSITRPARLYVTASILEEYKSVLRRKEFEIRKGLRLQFLDTLKRHARIPSPSTTLKVTSDPDDNKFIECADEAGADYLITGNQRHFPSYWKKTKVINSRDFVTLVSPHLGL